MSSYYTQPMPPPPGSWPPPPAPKKWYQRKGITIPLGVFTAFVLLGIIGQAFGLDDNKQTDGGGATVTAAAAPATVTVTPPPSTVAAAAPAAAAPTSTSPTSKAPKTTADENDSSESWTMPDETGKNLQGAQDDIQSVTDDGIFFTRSRDALGSGRMQILDRGWQVCSQNIAPGTKITSDSDIVFDVVRVSETCP